MRVCQKISLRPVYSRRVLAATSHTRNDDARAANIGKRCARICRVSRSASRKPARATRVAKSCTTVAVFVDTSVLVYARDSGELSKQARAAEWLRGLWLEQRGRTSVLVLPEYYTTVTRKLRPGLTPDEAWDDVTALFAWQPQQIDRHVLEKAREIERRHALSWWDSMIVAAAQIQNCEVLLSEDLQHGWTCGTLTVRNPFAGRNEEAAPSYPTFAVPLSRHRPRGRPKKRAPAA